MIPTEHKSLLIIAIAGAVLASFLGGAALVVSLTTAHDAGGQVSRDGESREGPAKPLLPVQLGDMEIEDPGSMFDFTASFPVHGGRFKGGLLRVYWQKPGTGKSNRSRDEFTVGYFSPPDTYDLRIPLANYHFYDGELGNTNFSDEMKQIAHEPEPRRELDELAHGIRAYVIARR